MTTEDLDLSQLPANERPSGVRVRSRLHDLLASVAAWVANLLPGRDPAYEAISPKSTAEPQEAPFEETVRRVTSSTNLPVQSDGRDPNMAVRYFGIEPCNPRHIAQIFAPGVKAQPFDPNLSYRVEEYSPPPRTVLDFLFQDVNAALKQHHAPVKLLLLQPVKTAEGVEVPRIKNKEPITSICVYFPPEDEASKKRRSRKVWMEISPVGPNMWQAGVKVGLGQPAVIRVIPPNVEAGFFEAQVEFLHDRGRLMRLSSLIDEGYMKADSVIQPLSQEALNYLEAKKAGILRHLPKAPVSTENRPPEYVPFPVRAITPRSRRAEEAEAIEDQTQGVRALPAPSDSAAEEPVVEAEFETPDLLNGSEELDQMPRVTH